MNNIKKGVLLGVCLVLVLGALDVVHAQAVPAVGCPMPVDAIEMPNGVWEAAYEGAGGGVIYIDYDGDGIMDDFVVYLSDLMLDIIIITPE
jgi:hypothetical protein